MCTVGGCGSDPADGNDGTPGSGGTSAYTPPYDPSFGINQPIPLGIASDPRSADIVSRLKLNTSGHKVHLANHLEVPPVYTVSPNDALYSVDLVGEPIEFRLPAKAVAGGGSDYPLIVLDPSHPTFGAFTELRVWQAEIDHSLKTLKGGGSGLFHYNNDGALLNPDSSPSVSVPFKGWGTGSGLSYLAGLIRPQEVLTEEIRHAIRFAYSNCDSSDQFRAPAVKTDQPKNCTQTPAPASERMDMGMRLQLDPTIDCNVRTVPDKLDTSTETQFLRLFCRALQDYGMIMLDGTGPGGLVIYMEHETTAGWQSIIGAELYESFSYIVRDQDTPDDGLTRGPNDGIPWEKLRVLEKSVF